MAAKNSAVPAFANFNKTSNARIATAMTAKGIVQERNMLSAYLPYEIADQKEYRKNRPGEKADCGGSLDLVERGATENRVCPGDPSEYPA
jgi:hypothetical protein